MNKKTYFVCDDYGNIGGYDLDWYTAVLLCDILNSDYPNNNYEVLDNDD